MNNESEQINAIRSFYPLCKSRAKYLIPDIFYAFFFPSQIIHLSFKSFVWLLAYGRSSVQTEWACENWSSNIWSEKRLITYSRKSTRKKKNGEWRRRGRGREVGISNARRMKMLQGREVKKNAKGVLDTRHLRILTSKRDKNANIQMSVTCRKLSIFQNIYYLSFSKDMSMKLIPVPQSASFTLFSLLEFP